MVVPTSSGPVGEILMNNPFAFDFDRMRPSQRHDSLVPMKRHAGSQAKNPLQNFLFKATCERAIASGLGFKGS